MLKKLQNKLIIMSEERWEVSEETCKLKSKQTKNSKTQM